LPKCHSLYWKQIEYFQKYLILLLLPLKFTLKCTTKPIRFFEWKWLKMNLPWSPSFTNFFSFNLLIFPIFLILSMATKAAFQQQNGEPDRSSCGDQFDVGLRRQCMRGRFLKLKIPKLDLILYNLGEWEEKYYFEHGSQTCRCPFFGHYNLNY